MAMVPPVILKAMPGRHTATLVFLHGLGDTGFGWSGALNTIKPAHMKIICPTAPIIPVTLNGGMQMPAWYDITSLDPHDPNRENMEGVDEACKILRGIIDAEIANEKVERDRIIVGGFSQGGAVALYTMLAVGDKKPFGGCIALSTYLPGQASDYKISHENSPLETPVLQCHGESDEVVPFFRGQEAHSILKKLVRDIEFKAYPSMGHEAVPEEMDVIRKFLEKHVPDKTSSKL